jgi:hypothetical protein
MKIENEITGEIAEVIESYVGIRLHICSFEGITDFFAVDVEEKEIITRLNATTKILLNIEHTFEDYMKLIADLDLGLEIPESYKKHWKPTLKDGTLWCYFVNSVGEIEGNSFSNSTFDNKLVANFNIFPNKELAEKSIKSSKLGRLILLWQYANDCLFEPDWLDGIQYKYYIIYDSRDKNACYDYSFRQKSNNIHFETSEQVKTFIDMYEAEIKELMNIK